MKMRPSLVATALLAVAPSGLAAVTSYRSAVAAEPSRLAAFPVDGDTGTTLTNTVAPAFGGTLQSGASISTKAGRTVGTHSTQQAASGRIALVKDAAWNFPDGTGTVETFLYQTASAAYNPCYASIRQDGAAGVRWSLHGDTAGSRVWFWNGGSVSNWTVSPSMINRLCHVVVVFSGGNATAYVNGVSLGTQANPLGSGNSAPAQLGASGPGNTEAWPGHIDETVIYADALPAAAVAAHYQAWLSNDSGSAPVISEPPQSLTRSLGQSAVFSVTLTSATGAVYRWQRDGVDIPGATASSYTLTSVTNADHGAQFRCIVHNPYGGTLSETATLSVVDDAPPALLGAAAPYEPGVVVLTFDEAVDTQEATFSVTGASVLSVAPGPQPGTVVLRLTGLAAGTTATVTASNIKDTTGNVLTSASSSFTAAPPAVPAPIDLVRPGREPVGPASRRGGLVISEINYHPIDRPDGRNLEFVEVCNTLPWTEDLTGFRLSGEIDWAFPAGTTLAAGACLVVAADPAALADVHGLSGVLGPYTGALNNAGGRLRLRDDMDAVVFEVEYDSGHPWQPAADGAGHTLVLARPSHGMNDPRAWDASFALGGSPGAVDPFPADPWRTVVINEVWPLGLNGDDFVELYNYSISAVDVSGCSLSDDRNSAKYVIPAATTIPAGGILVLSQSTLGFGLKAGGDTVFFRAPAAPDSLGRVLDCVRFGPQLPGTSWSRVPDGAPVFTAADEETDGGPNDTGSARSVVFSEIFYNPPPSSTQPPFVELTNVSGNPVDLGGWRLRGGITHDFPAGTTLAPGAAVAVSNFTGSLSAGTGERLRLEMPATEPDGTGTIHPVVDEVTYRTGGRWGRDSDGGGSSLERTDLRADGRLAGNWMDSDESAKADWVQISHTGVLDNGQPGSTVNRVEIMLLGAGEVLVDDVELVQGAGANTVTNPGFESGFTGWAADGTHSDSTVEAGAGVGGSAALHLRASARGDLAGNRILGSLTSTLGTGSSRTLRAKVKYLRGHPEILLRVHGGWLEATGSVAAGLVHGTPGAANSRAVANTGPAIADVTHRPVLPQSGQVATVYATVADRDGLSAIFLNYRVDPATATTSVLMSPRGAGLFSADIPAQTSGKVVAFSITAADALGAASTFPTAAPERECLIRWGDTQPAGNSLPTYRLWLSQKNVAAWSTRLKNSNTLLDATFVAGDFRVIHNAGAMYSGSPFHTGGFNGPTGNACDYTVSVPPDDRFLDSTDMIWAGPGTFGSDSSQVREQMAWWIARKMKSPALHRRFVNVYVNGVRRGQIMEDTQQPNGDFLDEYFPDDSGGPLYKAQDWIEYNDDGAGFQALTRAVLARALSGGQHKISTYRYRWAVRSSSSGNDYAAFTPLVDAFNTGTSASDPAFFNALDPLVDQDSWSRALAIQRIVGNWDTWGWSYGKNMYAYKPERGPWAMFAWDMDFGFGPDGSGNPAPDTATAGLFQNTSNFDGGAPGDPLATKFRTQPAFRRAYWCALLDAANGPMEFTRFNARADLVAAALTANGISVNATQLAQVKSYVSGRRSYIITQATAVFGSTSFGVSGSGTITDDDGLVTLVGTARADVKTIRINGVPHTPTWTSETAWTLPVTLYASSNELLLEALDLAGNVVATRSVTVTVTNPPAIPPVTINEWLADNVNAFADPADGQFEDFIELHNASASAVSLGGFFLSDDPSAPAQWAIPPGTTIPAGGKLLVWADGEPEQHGVTAGQLHAPFKLSAAGESIVLSTPDLQPVDSITFGPQSANVSEGRFPDGGPLVGSLSLPTPADPNALTTVLSATLDPAGFHLTLQTTPGLRYQLQSSPDLVTWTDSGAPATATSTTTPLTDAAPVVNHRFYRIVTLR